MAKIVRAPGIRAPNASILAGNILRNMDTPGEVLRMIVSPGSEAGMDAVARKYGYAVEISAGPTEVEVRMVPSGKSEAEIDVTGETCPGPVILAGERLAELAVGDRLKIRAASADTIADVAAGLTASGSRVVGQGTEGDRHFVTVEKGEKKAPPAGAAAARRDGVLICQSNGIGNAERAYATFIFSKVALSMGKHMTIFLLMDGVGIARKGNAEGVKHPAFAPLDQLMAEVLKAGAVIYACELSASFRKIGEGDLVPGVKMAGAATYLQLLSDPGNAIVNF